MPVWIVEELLKEKTDEEVEQICKNSNLKPKLSIRVNNLKTNKQELIEKLENKNIQIEDGKLEDFLFLHGVRNIENIDEFKNGLFTVQDEAAGLVVLTLEPKPSETILDACSAPGGKTTYIGEIVENEGRIEAWDIYEHRTNLVKENAKRLGINIIETKIQDSSVYNEKYYQKFDKILLDVPCLGLGVLRRKPDIKWQRKKEDIEEITKLQEKILLTCSKYLKPKGNLVYSTCSILQSENKNIIEKFIKENNEFKILESIQLYQNEVNDGFFICKMEKK